MRALAAPRSRARTRAGMKQERAEARNVHDLPLQWIQCVADEVGMRRLVVLAFGVLLLEGRDRHGPLFLQIKEATYSVLAEHLRPSPYENHGQRVVEGQRLTQTASDIFLGWTRSIEPSHDFYWRQLRDWKGSVDVDALTYGDLRYLAKICGWTLARAHARTGDPVAMAAYLGQSKTFDESFTEFAVQTAVPHAFIKAVGSLDIGLPG